MMKKAFFSRIMAAMLGVAMTAQNLPFSAFAEGSAQTDVPEQPDAEETFIIDETISSGEAPAPLSGMAETLDFSSQRLLVCTEDESIFAASESTDVIAAYDGVYLLGFESADAAREAYIYYSTAAASVEPDIALYVADDAYLQDDAALPDIEVVYNDPLTCLVDLIDETNETAAHYDIALVDTGLPYASGTGVSVLPGSAMDDNGHAGRMYEAITGISPELSVLSIKAFDSHGIGSISSVFAAMVYAVEMDADVIDLSFAAKSYADSAVLERAVSMAQERNIVVVGAAGNDHADAAAYIPGRVPGITIAGACDATGEVLPSSNFGETVFCNVAAQSTSEAAARLSAMIAAYGMDYVEAEMNNGIVFRNGESRQDEETPTEETPGNDLFSPAELAEDTLNAIYHKNSVIAGAPAPDPYNPPEQTPVEGKNVTINHVYVRWLSKGDGDYQPFGDLTLEPEGRISSDQQFQIDFDLSGDTPYAPGEIEITFPAYLWKDRDGEECGTLTLSVPADPNTGAEYAWKRVGDNIVITNVKTIPAATKVMIQGTFRNVDATEIENESRASDFIDGKGGFNATVTVTRKGESVSMKSNDIDATMNTHVEIKSAGKTAYDATTSGYTVWWDEFPGEMPNELRAYFTDTLQQDPADYLFVRWYVEGLADGNQPFIMDVYDEIGAVDGYMLGITGSAEGTVLSKDGGHSVSAKLFVGYSTLPQSAYVWAAYKKSVVDDEEYKNEDGLIEIPNKSKVTVTGMDDRKESSKEPEAKIEVRQPTNYTFVKKWDDDDDKEGHRPKRLGVKVYSKELDKTVTYWIDENCEQDDDGNWTFTWSDNGQNITYTVDEILENASGVELELYDGSMHEYSWKYYLSKYVEDREQHTWTFTNSYTAGWNDGGTGSENGDNISYIRKNNTYTFGDNALISKRDGMSLNKLMLGKKVYVPFEIDTVVSAAERYNNDRGQLTSFALEDTEYYFLGAEEERSYEEIGAVTLKAPEVYIFEENWSDDPRIPGQNHWFEKKQLDASDTMLQGRIDDKWIDLAAVSWKASEKTVTGSVTSLSDGVSYTSTTSGRDGATYTNLRFELPEGITGIRWKLVAAAAFVHFQCTPEIRLTLTDEIEKMITDAYKANNDYAKLTLYNKANSFAEDIQRERFTEQDAFSYAYLHGKQYKVAADLTKSFKVVENDTVNKQLVLRSTLEMTQQSNVLSIDDFRQAVAQGEIPCSEGGIYYDLLPHGVEPDLNTVVLTPGDRVVAAYTKPNYKGSGRTLLIVEVEFAEHLLNTVSSPYEDDPSYPSEGYRSSHTMTFDSYILHDTIITDEIINNDLKNLHNVAAFEADEKSIGSIQNWEGEKDSPTGTSHKRSKSACKDPDESDLMSGLDSKRNDPSFVYAGAALEESGFDLTAMSGLQKQVRAEGFSGKWSTGRGDNDSVNVQEGGRYVYRLRISSKEDNTDSIVVVDSLENYVHQPRDTTSGNEQGEEDQETLDTDKRWRGQLVSIDLSSAIAKGAAPVVYYSTAEFDVYKEYKNVATDTLINNLKNGEEGRWQELVPEKWGDISSIQNIQAIAIDLSSNKDGGKFILRDKDSIPILLHMQAPFDKESENPNYLSGDFTDPDKNGHAYNEVYLSCRHTGSAADSSYLWSTYTKVGIYSKNIEVRKVWDDDDNRDGVRPDSITVKLKANGKVLEGDEYSVTLNKENNWSHTFTRLLTYDDDNEYIVYTCEEELSEYSDKYTLYPEISYDGDTMSVILTNKHDPDKISIPVRKQWKKDDNGEIVLPKSITFRLLANGKDTGRKLTVVPDANGDWYGEFTDLEEHYDQGKNIIYEVVEDPVENFIQEGAAGFNENGKAGIEFTNRYQPYGDIILTKKVEGGTDESKAYTQQKKFEFTLQLYTEDEKGDRFSVIQQYDYYVYDPLKYPTAEALNQAIADGILRSEGIAGNGSTLYLAEGEAIIIKGIPTGVKCILTETPRKEYEIVEQPDAPGTIKSGVPVEAAFTNKYITKGTATIHAGKTLSGREQRAYQFRFELVDEKGTILSANNTKDGDVTFSVHYSNEDTGKTYTYTLREYIPDPRPDGYTYDDTVYKIEVTVRDNGKGSIICEVVYYDKNGNKIGTDNGVDAYTDEVPVFENEYNANGEVNLKAWKDLEGRGLKEKEFSFALYDQEFKPLIGIDGKPVIVSNDADSSIQFPPIAYTEKDDGKTYYYYAREIRGDDETVIYDTSLICYKVTVIDKGDGTLEFIQSSYVLKDPENCEACKGTGRYNGTDCDTCYGSGLKDFFAQEVCSACEGEENLNDEACSECQGTGAVIVPAWEQDAKIEAAVFTNGLADGYLSVTKLTEGEYTADPELKFRFHVRLVGDKISDTMKLHYFINEPPAPDPDPEEPDPDPDENDPDSDETEPDSGETESDPDENDPDPDETESDPGETDPDPDETEPDSGETDPDPGENDPESQEPQLLEIVFVNGEAVFDLAVGQTITIVGIPAGTAYQVWEDDVDGWYLVKQENASGLIAPTETASARFTNIEDQNRAKAIIVGTKLLDNKPAHQANSEETFMFEILENGKVLKTVPAQPGGFIQFEMEYDDKDIGTHKYTIREVDNSKNNELITYDPTSKTVTVVVDKNASGALTATVNYGEDGSMQFKNYTVPGGLQITKNTIGTNAVNKDQEFTFKVTFYNENGLPLSGSALYWYTLSADSSDAGDSGQTSGSNISSVRINRNSFIRSYSSAENTPAEPERSAPARVSGRSLTARKTGDGEYVPPTIEAVKELKTKENVIASGTDGGVAWSVIRTGGTGIYLNDSKTTADEYVLLLEAGAATADRAAGVFKSNNSNSYGWRTDATIRNIITTVLVADPIYTSESEKIFGLFESCANLVYADLTNLDLSYKTATGSGNIGDMFENCYNLQTAIYSGNPITGRCGAGDLFFNCKSLKTVTGLNIQYTGTSGGNFNNMFRNCPSLTSIDLSGWKMGGKTSVDYLFIYCASLTSVTLDGWENIQLSSMHAMFHGCTSLSSLDVSRLNTSQVTSMREVFAKCTNLTELDLTSWDTGNVTNMIQMFMESGITTLNTDGWDVRKVTSMEQMFFKCASLRSIDLSNWIWADSKDAANLTDLKNLFVSCAALETVDVTGWNTSKVTQMNSLFDDCRKLTTLTGIGGWDTGSALNMNQMFMKCVSLANLEISEWDTSQVTTMTKMFYMADSNARNYGLKYLDLSGWTTSNVTNMDYMFDCCTNLETLDISGWDTGKVTNMTYMFGRCYRLSEIKGIENLDTSSVTNMSCTFMEWAKNCENPVELKLTNWRTGNVTNFYQMFKDCTKLAVLDIGQFTTNSNTSATQMFENCKAIKEITLNRGLFAGGNIGSVVASQPPGPGATQKWILKENLNLPDEPTFLFQELAEGKDDRLTGTPATYVWSSYAYYSVTFTKGNEDAQGSMKTGISAPDAVYNLPECTFTFKDHLFIGWEVVSRRNKDGKEYPASEIGKQYPLSADGKAEIPANTYAQDDEIELKAIWVKYSKEQGVPYYIDIYKENPDYDPAKPGNGGKYILDLTIVDFVKNLTDGETVTLTLPGNAGEAVQNQLRALSDHYKLSKGSTVEISLEGGFRRAPLYYDLIRYTVHFVGGDGATGSMADLKLAGNIPQTLGIGFQNGTDMFVGWATKPDGDAVFSAASACTIDDFRDLVNEKNEVTLYAVWLENDNKTEPSAGEITVTCKAGETIVFPGLPAGTTYTIEEISIPDGWKKTAAGGSTVEGDIISGTISSKVFDYAWVTNEYKAEGIALIEAHKELIGDTLLENEFAFELLRLSEPECSRTNNFDENGTLTEFPMPNSSEEHPITFAGAQSLHVELQYSTRADASVRVKAASGGEVLETWQGNDSATFDINGDTVIFEVDQDADYYAKVYGVYADVAGNGTPDQLASVPGENNEMVDNEWFNTGIIKFETLKYTAAGVYEYYIRERIHDDSTIVFDTTIFKVVVDVTDNGNGILSTKVSYYDLEDETGPLSGARFTNQKKTGQLALSKTLIDPSGKVSDTKFTFRITLTDKSGNPISGTYDLITDSAEALLETPTDEEMTKPPDNEAAPDPGNVPGDGTDPGPTDPPVNTKPETITFVDGVAELSLRGGETFIIEGLPHGAVYTVTEAEMEYFEQTEVIGENGKIVGGETSAVSFTNIYRTSDLFQLIAKKNFVGGDISQQQFTFDLMDRSHYVIDTATSNSDGNIVFKAITYTEEDISDDPYIYYVKEVNGNDSNIRYDEKEYCIKVYVGKDEDHKIKISAVVVMPDGKEIPYEYDDDEENPVLFTNILQYDLTVSKSVTGTFGDRKQDFDFVLTLKNDNCKLPDSMTWTKGTETKPLKPDKNGQFAFKLCHGESITFSGIPAGTVYTITEAENPDYDVGITVTGDAAAIVEGRTVTGTLSAAVNAAYVNDCQIDAELPGAGYFGGTGWLYRLGTVVILSGMLQAVLYVRRRRRED